MLVGSLFTVRCPDERPAVVIESVVVPPVLIVDGVRDPRILQRAPDLLWKLFVQRHGKIAPHLSRICFPAVSDLGHLIGNKNTSVVAIRASLLETTNSDVAARQIRPANFRY